MHEHVIDAARTGCADRNESVWAATTALADRVPDQCGRRQGCMAVSADAFSLKRVASLVRDEKTSSQAAVLFAVRAIAMRAVLGER